MAVEQTSSKQCDACVVYDESNLAESVVEIILTPLKDKGVTCCDIELDILPGQPLLERMRGMIERSKCILVVHPIQQDLHSMLERVCSSCIFSKQCISLSFEQGQEGQASDVIVTSETPHWLEEVLSRMTSSVLNFHESDTNVILCKIPQSTNLFDYIFQSGLRNISSTDMNILGIKIMPSSKEIKLDLSDCMKNIESHEQYKTDEVVEMLQCIRSMSTQVELRIDAEAEDMIDIVGRGVDKIFPTICSCVLNVGDRKQCEWILVYTLSGPRVLDRKFMARIYHLSRHAIIGSSFPDEVQHRDFADEQRRKVTFNGTVFHTKAASMAEAGFFFDGLIDRARCYYCGGARVDWKESDDPWTMHAEGFPRCPLVKANMSEAAIDEIIKSDLEQNPSGNPYYEPLEKRKLTMHSMLMTQPSGNNGNGREKFLSDVAKAGFYYIGPEDRVKCFSCGVMLSGIRLLTLDQLLIQHACVSSTCVYVKSKCSPDTLQCVIDMTTVRSKCLSVCFFVKTFDRNPSTWPSNMLCS